MDDRICFFVSKLFCGTSSFEALSFKMNAFKDFLESTTIHGLIYISTSRSTLGKLAWSSFVLARFSLAAYLISSSYMEMQESPISTSISTHSTSSPVRVAKNLVLTVLLLVHSKYSVLIYTFSLIVHRR